MVDQEVVDADELERMVTRLEGTARCGANARKAREEVTNAIFDFEIAGCPPA